MHGGSKQNLEAARLRYEISISRELKRKLNLYFCTHESLSAIPKSNDLWLKVLLYLERQAISPIQYRTIRTPFIQTKEDDGILVGIISNSNVLKR